MVVAAPEEKGNRTGRSIVRAGATVKKYKASEAVPARIAAKLLDERGHRR